MKIRLTYVCPAVKQRAKREETFCGIRVALQWRVRTLDIHIGDPRMTVRLVKREKSASGDAKRAPLPSRTQLIVTTQGWVEEFKSRKARTEQSLLNMIKAA